MKNQVKKLLLLLLLVPLAAHADPHFGPDFERNLLLTALIYFFALPLLAAQLVNWGFRKINGKGTNIWAASIVAVAMDWVGVYCVLSGGLSLENGLFGLSGGLFLAIFSVVGALAAAAVVGTVPPMKQ